MKLTTLALALLLAGCEHITVQVDEVRLTCSPVEARAVLEKMRR